MSFMNDQKIFSIPKQTTRLRRPAALIRAARAGQAGWRRNRDLPRLLAQPAAPLRAAALRLLYEAELKANDMRRAGRAEYDLHRHIRLLIALLAEISAAEAPSEARPAWDGSAF